MCNPLQIMNKPPPEKLNLKSLDVETKQFPISTGFPAYSVINRRRRITCRNCQTPIGYLTLDQIQIESCRSKATREAKLTMDDRFIGAICIPDPINVFIPKLGKPETNMSDTYLPYGANVFESLPDRHCEAEPAICDDCGQCLGVRITVYEAKAEETSETLNASAVEVLEEKNINSCRPPPRRKEVDRYYTFSYDAIEIQPIFGLVGLNELSSRYYGGEKYFAELPGIEDSESYSNNSYLWMQPMHRRPHQVEVPKKTMNNAWPMLHMDLVKESALPSGIINHTTVQEMALSDAESAFSKQLMDRWLTDNSVLENERKC